MERCLRTAELKLAPAMEGPKTTDIDNLSIFFDSGMYRFEGSNAIFVDPDRVLNRPHTRFRVSSNSRKRKRKVKKPRTLNEREQVADQRRKEVSPLLVKARQYLL